MTQTMDNTKTAPENMFKQTNEAIRSMMDNGFRFQQDAARGMGDFFACGEGFEDMRTRLENTATDSLNMVRKNTECFQKFVDDGCRTGAEFVRKTFEASNGKNHDMFDRTRDFWNNAFSMMRHNVESAAKTSAQAIDSWSEFVGKTMPAAEKKAAK